MKKKITSFLSLLLAAAVLLTTGGIPVSAQTVSGNGQSEEEEEAETSFSDFVLEENGAMEDTVSGQDMPKIQTGAVTGPANPVHHCTKENDGSDYTDFDYVYFGSYPQSEVTDSATIDDIYKAIFLYNSGITTDVGTDVWIKGTKYRMIQKKDTNSDYNFDEVKNGGYRYFKWERIKWKVLQNDGNTLFLVADKAIDDKDYNEIDISNIWENSTIRNWLNTSFYNTAFSSRERSAIAAQTVVNEDNEDNPWDVTEGGNNTNDKVYLLSIGEVTDERFGFCSDYSTYSASRRTKASDYAHARGTYTLNSDKYKDNCVWWLRSPGESYNCAAEVYCYGNGRRDAGVSLGGGVCPALHINLSSAAWLTADDGTSGESSDEKATMPTASLPTGSSVAQNTKLSLSCATTGAAILYTTDGTIPNMDSSLYTGKIIIDSSMTIKAVAVCQGYRISDVAEFTYTIKQSGGGENGSKENQNNSGKLIQKLAIKAPSKKLAAGTKVKLALEVTPQNAANQAVKWKTGNQKYATVDKNGKLSLKKNGIGKEVTITATATDGSGEKAAIKIKIMRHAVKSIKLKAPKKTLKTGKSMTIQATVNTTGKNANKSLKWTSSNKKYATVNSKGKVTAKKAGKRKTVTITAKSTDGSNQKATVKVQIK